MVLGAGPAGLGATLALARAGAPVTLIDAPPRPGGLCVTHRRDGLAYDLGGHIPFVRDAARLAWLRELVGDDLHWVPRPVGSLHDGVIRRGRYLDQLPPGSPEPGARDGSARGELGRRVGPAFAEATMRRYLEKIDGVPWEHIPAERARRLLEDQAAPDGFHFPAHGIGQLMDAMADAARAEGARILSGTTITRIHVPGGRAAGVSVDGPGGARNIAAERIVVALPAGLAARMAHPGPEPPLAPVRMRAVCLVYIEVTPAQPFTEAWVQVDHPGVPFARAFVPGTWSPALVPGDRTLFGLECYCQADAGDPIWGLHDDALARACARALVDPLGWIDPAATPRAVEVVRLPRAYPLPDLRQAAQMAAPAHWLNGLDGVWAAPGAAVIEAIENGERAAAAALADPVPA